MKAIRFIRTLCIVCCFLAANFSSAFSQNNEKFMIGNWLGNIEFQGKKLPIVIRILSIEKDTFTAFMDSPDQGAKDIKITRLLLRNDSAIIRIKSLSASISGLINVKDSTIRGVPSKYFQLSHYHEKDR